MIRLFLFVTAIFTYSAIGLIAYSQNSATTATAAEMNVTVIEKTSDTSIVEVYAMERCTAQVCPDGINI